MNIKFLIFLLFFSSNLMSQNKRFKNYFPIWTFHKDSINIYGVSVGLWTLKDEPRYTNTNGIKFELIGIGLLSPLMPSSPVSDNEKSYIDKTSPHPSEKINGINFSTSGTFCECNTNGLLIGGIGQYNYKLNGLSTTFLVNLSEKTNGIMVSLTNETYIINGLQIGVSNFSTKTNGFQIGFIRNISKEVKGIQIGFYNKTEKLKGLQIGIINKNEKRVLPIINWN